MDKKLTESSICPCSVCSYNQGRLPLSWKVCSCLQEEILMGRWRHPCLSLHGIEGAFSGPGGKTVIPRKVIGKFSVRTVPNQTIEKVEKLVLDHIEGLWKARRSPNKMKVGTKCTDGNLLLKKGPAPRATEYSFMIFWILERSKACFASTNFSFVTRNLQKEEVRNSGIHLNHRILISNFYFFASQNGTTRQTDERWCPPRFSILFTKICFTG